jgi:hypothetical protein
MDSDLVPCILALQRADDYGVEAGLEGVGPELEILEDGDVASSIVAIGTEFLPLDAAGKTSVSRIRAFFLSSDSFWNGRRRFNFLQRNFVGFSS